MYGSCSPEYFLGTLWLKTCNHRVQIFIPSIPSLMCRLPFRIQRVPANHFAHAEKNTRYSTSRAMEPAWKATHTKYAMMERGCKATHTKHAMTKRACKARCSARHLTDPVWNLSDTLISPKDEAVGWKKDTENETSIGE